LAVACTAANRAQLILECRWFPKTAPARFAKLPEFHQFCLQTAVNHANGAGDGFAGKSAIVIKSLLLAGRANIAGTINL
jgi:hypothetical protein